MRKKQDFREAKTDLDSLALGVADQPARTGHALPADLAREILQERKFRLQRQNKKLDLEISRQELAYGDIQEFRNEVRRCNQTVKHALRAMVMQVSPQLATMDDTSAIQSLLMSELTSCFNNLAYEGGSVTGMQ